MMPKPVKQWGREDWKEFYGDPMNFSRMFGDYKRLKEDEGRINLSHSENMRLEVVVELINDALSV